MIVDARDVAEALLLAYEQPEAEGRYICTAHMIKMQDLVENLRSIYPYYNYPKKLVSYPIMILFALFSVVVIGH